MVDLLFLRRLTFQASHAMNWRNLAEEVGTSVGSTVGGVPTTDGIKLHAGLPVTFSNMQVKGHASLTDFMIGIA